MKKNILIVSHGAALGGSPISALNIGRFINKKEFQPIFVFGENGKIVDLAKSQGFKTFIIKKRGLFGIPTIFDFIQILLKENIHLVHLNTLTSYYKYPAIAAKILKKKTVWFIRENPEEKRCVRLKSYLNHFCNKIVTVSFDTADHIYYADKYKLMTIHNGIDLEQFNKLNFETSIKTLNLDSNYEYITTIASLEQRKGILDLIESFAQIHTQMPNVKLLIIGRDRTKKQEYLNKIIKMINDLNINDKVILYGESQNINEIMSISKIFVLSAYWEGLSRVLLEALACSVPIIATYNGGNKEQVFENINGYLYEAGDINTLAMKLKKLYSLPENEFEIFSLNSRKIAEDQFDIHLTTQKIETLYKSLL